MPHESSRYGPTFIWEALATSAGVGQGSRYTVQQEFLQGLYFLALALPIPTLARVGLSLGCPVARVDAHMHMHTHATHPSESRAFREIGFTRTSSLPPQSAKAQGPWEGIYVSGSQG